MHDWGDEKSPWDQAKIMKDMSKKVPFKPNMSEIAPEDV